MATVFRINFHVTDSTLAFPKAFAGIAGIRHATDRIDPLSWEQIHCGHDGTVSFRPDMKGLAYRLKDKAEQIMPGTRLLSRALKITGLIEGTYRYHETDNSANLAANFQALLAMTNQDILARSFMMTGLDIRPYGIVPTHINNIMKGLAKDDNPERTYSFEKMAAFYPSLEEMPADVGLALAHNPQTPAELLVKLLEHPYSVITGRGGRYKIMGDTLGPHSTALIGEYAYPTNGVYLLFEEYIHDYTVRTAASKALEARSAEIPDFDSQVRPQMIRTALSFTETIPGFDSFGRDTVSISLDSELVNRLLRDALPVHRAEWGSL